MTSALAWTVIVQFGLLVWGYVRSSRQIRRLESELTAAKALVSIEQQKCDHCEDTGASVKAKGFNFCRRCAEMFGYLSGGHYS